MITFKLIILAIHNLLRWVILVGTILALLKMYSGWLGKKTWNPSYNRLGTILTIALDSQLLAGFLLYFILSDLTKTAFTNLNSAMTNPTLRFFTVEHSLLMIFSILFTHIGHAMGKKALPDQVKFKRIAFLYSLSLIFLLLGIPWTSRPLFPGL